MFFLKSKAIVLTSVYAVLTFLVSCATPQAGEPAVKTINGIQQPVLTKPNLPAVEEPKPIVKLAPAANTAPKVTAPAVIVYDPRTGRVLYEKNARQRRAVASTQKLLTALLALEHGIEKTVTVPKEATSVVPSKLYLVPGTQYRVSSLVEAMLVKSGNDVAYTIGHGVAGSNAAFIQMMNARARELGMFNSNFKNAHGLTVAGQYSTAYDIALLGAAAYRYDYVRQVAKKKETIFTYAGGRQKTLYNTNKLLGKVPFCDGLKTGTTRASGNCLVSSATVNGESRIVVVLGATSRENLWKDSEALLRWSVEN